MCNFSSSYVSKSQNLVFSFPYILPLQEVFSIKCNLLLDAGVVCKDFSLVPGGWFVGAVPILIFLLSFSYWESDNMNKVGESWLMQELVLNIMCEGGMCILICPHFCFSCCLPPFSGSFNNPLYSWWLGMVQQFELMWVFCHLLFWSFECLSLFGRFDIVSFIS